MRPGRPPRHGARVCVAGERGARALAAKLTRLSSIPTRSTPQAARWPNKVGPYRVTRTMGSSVSVVPPHTPVSYERGTSVTLKHVTPLHPSPVTLHHTLHTLHSTPHTVHHTPYTLGPYRVTHTMGSSVSAAPPHTLKGYLANKKHPPPRTLQ